LPVSILNIPDLNKDVHGDIARIMAEDNLALRGKKVLLKPNFVECHEGRPINTDIRLIRQVAEACFQLGAREILIGEAAGHQRDPWHLLHGKELVHGYSRPVRCVDLNHETAAKIRNRGPYTGFQHFYVATSAASADVVISMPKMKTHHWAGVTLSMKNLFGTLPGIFYGWPKNPLHLRGIENSVVDLALSVPVHYAIVDGVIGMEGDGPIMGSAKHVGAVIMGRSLLAVDCVSARIMGFDPQKIAYLAMAGEHLPGLSELSVSHRGENPKRFSTKFSCLPHLAQAQLS
jgi:uncharacterized protein (DUF362 family)